MGGGRGGSPPLSPRRVGGGHWGYRGLCLLEVEGQVGDLSVAFHTFRTEQGLHVMEYSHNLQRRLLRDVLFLHEFDTVRSDALETLRHRTVRTRGHHEGCQGPLESWLGGGAGFHPQSSCFFFRFVVRLVLFGRHTFVTRSTTEGWPRTEAVSPRNVFVSLVCSSCSF